MQNPITISLQFTGTPATKYYQDPTIPEVQQVLNLSHQNLFPLHIMHTNIHRFITNTNIHRFITNHGASTKNCLVEQTLGIQWQRHEDDIYTTRPNAPML